MAVMTVGFHSAACREMRRRGMEVSVSFCPDVASPAGEAAVSANLLPFDALYRQFEASFDPELEESFAHRVRRRCYMRFVRGLLHDPDLPAQRNESWLHGNSILENQLQHFNRLIREREIGVILFSSPPYQSGAVLLHVLAEELGVKMLIARKSPWKNAFWIAETLDGFRPAEATDCDGFEDAMASPTNQLNGSAPARVGHLALEVSHALRTVEATARTGLLEALWNPGGLRASLRRLDRARRERRMRNRQAQLCAPPPTGRYVYLTLPSEFEPEADALGGAYADPLLALEELRRALPSEIAICVQEKPGQTDYMREQSFFERLTGVPNVQYVSSELSTEELLRGATAVVSIGDGEGWRALLLGKPVIAFGAPWFAETPGVFLFDPNPADACAQALAHRVDGDAARRAIATRAKSLYRGALSGAEAGSAAHASAVADAFSRRVSAAREAA